MFAVPPSPSGTNFETLAPISEILTGAEFRRLGRCAFDFNGKAALQSVVTGLGASVGLPTDLQTGIHAYVLRHNMISSEADAHAVADFIVEAGTVFQGLTFEKARGFVYLPDGKDLTAVTLQSALKNARFMFNVLGADFFSVRRGEFPRTEVLEAPIGGSDFHLTLKGTSGSGTISLDFTIAKLNSNHTKLHPLWKMGLDTKETEGALDARIIRSGSTLGKRGTEQSAFDHRAAFGEFRQMFKISPQRALACLTVVAASAMGCAATRALTDEGAFQFSTLRSPEAGAHYVKLFSGLGFKPRSNSVWMHLEPGNSFKIPVVANGSAAPGLQRYERHGLKAVLKAFGELRSVVSAKTISHHIPLAPALEALENV